MRKPLDVASIPEWTLRNWSVALDYWERETALDLSTALALEIGAADGLLSLWIASRGATVVCSDLRGPTKLARDLHERYGVADRISYQAIDATSIPYNDHFDIVMQRSVLGDIGRHDDPGRQRQAIDAVRDSLKPGGEFWFAENLIASPLHRFFRRQLVNWGTAWRYVSVEEILDFLGLFSRTSFVTAGFLGPFGRNETQRQYFGVIDRMLFDHVMPQNWKHIIAGIAQK